MNEEMVVLVDPEDVEIDVAPRELAHREGLLHRAVSVFAFNDRGEVLLQRRSPTKSLFAGMWANTCCTHPGVGESVVQAGTRRLGEEMGLSVQLKRVGAFIYRAVDERSGHIEHELDHVLVGRSQSIPVLDSAEADDHKWMDFEYLTSVAADPGYAPWLGSALTEFPRLIDSL